MNKSISIKAPTKRDRISLRIMILIGLLSIIYFFYWFLKPELIEYRLLFWILFISIGYDTVKILYIWYHYLEISVPKKPKVTLNLTVDVLTTYFPGEPYEMIKETLIEIQRMKYPHTTYLCDEANDEYLKEFCAENNIIHVTRNNRINAKAGNINNALLQAKGEICLILDPDHVPSENFLDEVIPYFADESLGFVQTVQAYYNTEESAVAKGAAEQTFHFYGPVMMCMNSYGTVNAIGANCVFRRAALDSIGGHAAGLSEDMHTAMQLHAKGWKSIYVPQIFTKGLVPASLTAYYKQQLKWSRGTLELLFAVYPKLFRKFSWRQKLHYGLLPFHYLSGISYLINFLVPIISLFAAATPWKGNIVNFGLILLPVLICILGVRFYVQRWVMYSSERGMHLTGGLLLTCTWWIYIVGLVYTIIRKKVPYLPTPKEDKESTSWKILIPNLFIGVVSIIAVIYGLSIDFTPFSLFMSGFALLNASFMFYTLFFAYQKPRVVSLKDQLEDHNKPWFERVQHMSYRIWHKAALPITSVVLIVFILVQYNIENRKWQGVKPEVQNKHLLNYLGIFAPQADNGITNLKNVREVSNQIGENFDIISLYIPWDKNIESTFPGQLLDSIYIQKSVPMITWEPWLNTFVDENPENKHVFELITEGSLDDYVTSFAHKLKNLERPVFLRFAHEFDNPFYPWYESGDEASPKFKTAWIHIYNIFKNVEANNVIWIWNPWKAENVWSFYPGKEYIDWIGVNILNYGKFSHDGNARDFESLYAPFHNEFKDLPATPVIISEFGTLKDDQRQVEWYENAFSSIERKYSEIKSVVYFNSKVDNNWPKGLQKDENLDWTISHSRVIKNSFGSKEVPDYVFSPLPKLIPIEPANISMTHSKLVDVQGINLKIVPDWRKDYHVMSRRNLLNDFEKLRRLGINTIKFVGNTIYEYNILSISKEFGFNVSYGFWISEEIDFVADTLKTNHLKQSILEKIKINKNNKTITSWNIQNDVQYNQRGFFLKPRLLFQNTAYLSWLSDLVVEIKKIDSVRPVIVDLEVNLQSIYHSKMLMKYVKGIDYFGLIVKDDVNLDLLINHLNDTGVEFIYSEIEVPFLTKQNIPRSKTPFFVTSFQDRHESNKLTFDGIVDWKGRYKLEFFMLQNSLQKTPVKAEFPVVRILRPSSLVFDNLKYDYYAMCYDSISGWKNGGEIKDLSFEWSLVKCDEYGNYLAIKDVGFGPKLSLEIPTGHTSYRLLLSTTHGAITSATITTLDTPIALKTPK